MGAIKGGHIQCPKCTCDQSDVYDSRAAMFEGLKTVRRRRTCRSCGHRWITYEIRSDFVEGQAKRLVSGAATDLAQSFVSVVLAELHKLEVDEGPGKP